MVSIFYNKNGLLDSLIICIKNLTPTEVSNNKEYAILKNEKEIIGINIFNFSKYTKLQEGMINPDKKIIELIKEITKIDLTNNVEKNFVVGEIVDINKIENSNANLCKVKVNETHLLNIVCGASNVKKNCKVVVANIDTFMPDGTFINKGKVYGFESYGMICSKKELNIIDLENQKGIYILPPETKCGTNFIAHYANVKI